MNEDRHYRDPFPPARGDRRPAGIEIREGFIDPDNARELVAWAESRPAERLKVVDPDSTGGDTIEYRFDERRVTERVDLGEREGEIENWIASVWTGTVAAATGRALAWFERPQILKYSAGGFYAAHADADNYDEQAGRWRHDLDRDFSLLLYLNDDFEGGRLAFEYFDYRITPSAGMLVWFPSDARYFHGAETTRSGTRYAIVSWAAARDAERVRSRPPDSAVML